MPGVFLADKDLCSISRTNFLGLSDRMRHLVCQGVVRIERPERLPTEGPQLSRRVRRGLPPQRASNGITLRFKWLRSKIQAAP